MFTSSRLLGRTNANAREILGGERNYVVRAVNNHFPPSLCFRRLDDLDNLLI
jgi:hypothetical protein